MENFENKFFAGTNNQQKKDRVGEYKESIFEQKEQLRKLETEKEGPSKLSLLQIEPTTRCNLDCIYCARKRFIKSGEITVGDVETEKILVALKKLKGKVETVLYQGWGEPMLCRDLPKLLEKAHKIGAKTAIVTNGVIFKKEVFDKCDSVTVSIDSFRPDYIGRRGVSSAKVKENIINLRNNYPNLPILLEAVVSKKNIDELEEIIDFAKEIKAKVKFLLQIGEALPSVDNHDIQKIESLASANPDIVEWSKPEELLLNKEHSVLKNKLYVDIHGKVTIPYHEKDVLLGGIEEIDKITDRLIKESSQSKSTRPYDLTDLQRLRPNLQERDFSMLRESLEREIEETEKMVREKLQEMWDSLTPMLELTHDQKVISEKLWEHPDLQKRRNDQKVSEFVSSISQYVSENPNITFEDFLSHSLAILKLQE